MDFAFQQWLLTLTSKFLPWQAQSNFFKIDSKGADPNALIREVSVLQSSDCMSLVSSGRSALSVIERIHIMEVKHENLVYQRS